MTTRQAPLARVGRNSVTITSLVATLAAGVAGCNNSIDRHGRAGLDAGGVATIQFDAAATQGRFRPAYFEEQARLFGAPMEWAESAGSAVTAVEAQRAGAEATRVRAAADHAAAIAEANRLLAEAVSAFEAEKAGSQGRRDSAEAGYAAREKEIAARRAAHGAEVQAGMGEAQAAFDAAIARAGAMRAAADEALALAEAEHKRALSAAEGERDRARVTIEQMRASAGAVNGRARAEAAAYRAGAAARRSSGRAQGEAHQSEIEGARSWAETAEDGVRRELEAVRTRTSAEVESIRARAAQIENWELDERYAAAVAEAGAEHDTAVARASMLRETATAELASAAAGFTADRTNLKSRLEDDGVTYEAELARIDSDTRVGEARAAIANARAQELEHDARAQFVSVLAGAVGGETHAQRSEAFAWAQGFADDVARSGEAPAGLNLDSPEVTGAIHAFIGQLAEAGRLRDEAVAAGDSARTAAIMRRSRIEVWWNESRAASEAAGEGIAHAEAEKIEALRQRFADADEVETHGRIAFERASLEAESARKEAAGRLAQLREQEEFALRSGEADVAALEARAVAIREEGAEKIAQLTRVAEAAGAAARAGAEEMEAKAEQLLGRARVEAGSLLAMASAAEATLDSEYEASAAEAERALAVARADYDEGMRVADSVTAFAEETRSDTVASIEFEGASFESRMETALAEARGLRDADIASAERALAEATASYAAFESGDVARRARAESVERALLAFVEEQHAVADARDAAVFADFSARLATLRAERDRTSADAYFAEFLAGAGLTADDMRRSIETANAALGRLREASSERAEPGVASEPTAAAAADGSVGVLDVESMSANGVATVPTDGHE